MRCFRRENATYPRSPAKQAIYVLNHRSAGVLFASSILVVLAAAFATRFIDKPNSFTGNLAPLLLDLATTSTQFGLAFLIQVQAAPELTRALRWSYGVRAAVVASGATLVFETLKVYLEPNDPKDIDDPSRTTTAYKAMYMVTVMSLPVVSAVAFPYATSALVMDARAGGRAEGAPGAGSGHKYTSPAARVVVQERDAVLPLTPPNDHSKGASHAHNAETPESTGPSKPTASQQTVLSASRVPLRKRPVTNIGVLAAIRSCCRRPTSRHVDRLIMFEGAPPIMYWFTLVVLLMLSVGPSMRVVGFSIAAFFAIVIALLSWLFVYWATANSKMETSQPVTATWLSVLIAVGGGAIVSRFYDVLESVPATGVAQFIVRNVFVGAITAIALLWEKTSRFAFKRDAHVTMFVIQLFDSFFGEILFLAVPPFGATFWAILVFQAGKLVVIALDVPTLAKRHILHLRGLEESLPNVMELWEKQDMRAAMYATARMQQLRADLVATDSRTVRLWKKTNQKLMAEALAGILAPIIVLQEVALDSTGALGRNMLTLDLSRDERYRLLLGYTVVSSFTLFLVFVVAWLNFRRIGKAVLDLKRLTAKVVLTDWGLKVLRKRLRAASRQDAKQKPGSALFEAQMMKTARIQISKEEERSCASRTCAWVIVALASVLAGDFRSLSEDAEVGADPQNDSGPKQGSACCCSRRKKAAVVAKRGSKNATTRWALLRRCVQSGALPDLVLDGVKLRDWQATQVNIHPPGEAMENALKLGGFDAQNEAVWRRHLPFFILAASHVFIVSCREIAYIKYRRFG